MTVQYLVGDTRQVTATIPDGSVSLVASSPPFLSLRDYAEPDNPLKHLEIGQEANPAEFIDVLLQLTAEWGRVLAPWGSIAIELGDSYSGSGGAGGDYNEGGLRDGQQKFSGTARKKIVNGGAGWPRAKCLALIPQAYALSLAYGRNVLSGEPSPAGQWLVRNVIVWHRPNPAVGALGDKVRPSTSYITVATRSPKRWFDLTAVRTPHVIDPAKRALQRTTNTQDRGDTGQAYRNTGDPAGAPPLDCWFDEHDTWTVTTQPSRLAHYAMWPAKLAERLILSMCPQWVCRDCGEPVSFHHDRPNTVRGVRRPDPGRVGKVAGGTSEAAVLLEDVRQQGDGENAGDDETPATHVARLCGTADAGTPDGEQVGLHHGASLPDVRAPRAIVDGRRGGASHQRGQERQPDRESTSDGEEGARSAAEAEAAPVHMPELRNAPGELRHALACPTCGSSDLTPGVALDPFCGTGTTLAVADLHNRDAIGIDLDARNELLYPARWQECRRALFGTPVVDPNQVSMFEFGEVS